MDSFAISTFGYGTIFDENGYAEADGYMLFSRGYYISCKNIINICMQKGIIAEICEDAEKCFDPETGKVLKKELQPNNKQDQTK